MISVKQTKVSVLCHEPLPPLQFHVRPTTEARTQGRAHAAVKPRPWALAPGYAGTWPQKAQIWAVTAQQGYAGLITVAN